ncbi:glutathione peroxidase [Pseudorhodoplanes sp.]|uniref:glutathione peroxidase n=1 Tax=Pseudorhodoplanes sp. TaxID=1934341 RepID=UPI002B564698|nr:glutathione peroxidase [Pseudorhodoplanes sp.]HWV54003.1 glutathione peroxidase [Pseudorhodoplanes sp.]
MIDRRLVMTGFAASAVLGSSIQHANAQSAMSRATAFGFSFRTLDGQDLRLADRTGRPVLVVNTASLCGYTPQYAGLESLWSRYRDRGLLVIGVPSNDFGGQEPGGPEEIQGTAHRHGVTFPITEKVAIKGDSAHPFYRWAAIQRPGETPRWNFHKYLVGSDGTLAAAFASAVEPTDSRVVAAIERQLPPA